MHILHTMRGAVANETILRGRYTAGRQCPHASGMPEPSKRLRTGQRTGAASCDSTSKQSVANSSHCREFPHTARSKDALSHGYDLQVEQMNQKGDKLILERKNGMNGPNNSLHAIIIVCLQAFEPFTMH
jgi:hypothetical protein